MKIAEIFGLLSELAHKIYKKITCIGNFYCQSGIFVIDTQYKNRTINIVKNMVDIIIFTD